MNNSTNLNIRIDKSVKDNSEKVLEDLGLNMTTAINMFLREVIRVNGIPFEIKGNTPNISFPLPMHHSPLFKHNFVEKSPYFLHTHHPQKINHPKFSIHQKSQQLYLQQLAPQSTPWGAQGISPLNEGRYGWRRTREGRLCGQYPA